MKTKFTIILGLFVFCFANAQENEAQAEVRSAKGVTFNQGDMFLEGGISFSTGDNQNAYSDVSKRMLILA